LEGKAVLVRCKQDAAILSNRPTFLSFAVWGIDGLASLWSPLGRLQNLEQVCIGGIFSDWSALSQARSEAGPDWWEFISGRCKQVWPFRARLNSACRRESLVFFLWIYSHGFPFPAEVKEFTSRSYHTLVNVPIEYHIARTLTEASTSALPSVLAQMPPSAYLNAKSVSQVIEDGGDEIIWALMDAGVDLSLTVRSESGYGRPEFLLFRLLSRLRPKIDCVKRLFFEKKEWSDGSLMTPFEWTIKVHAGFRFSDQGCLLAAIAKTAWEETDLEVFDLVWEHREVLNQIAGDERFVGDVNTTGALVKIVLSRSYAHILSKTDHQGKFLEQTPRITPLVALWMLNNGADPRQSLLPLCVKSLSALRIILAKAPELVAVPMFPEDYGFQPVRALVSHLVSRLLFLNWPYVAKHVDSHRNYVET
jgi:hypothetical protein